MARRKRDYKAEYARRKARSHTLGYRSPREEYKARKALNLPRDFPSMERKWLPDHAVEKLDGTRLRRLRKESQDWSNVHSHVNASRYSPRWGEERVEAYHHAFVQRVLFGSRRGKAKEKKLRIFEYIKRYINPDAEWSSEWTSELQSV